MSVIIDENKRKSGKLWLSSYTKKGLKILIRFYKCVALHIINQQFRKAIMANDLFVVFTGAVLRGVTFTKDRYDSFIDLQVPTYFLQGRNRLILIGGA